MASNKKQKKTTELHINDRLPTLIVDNLSIANRTDGLYFIRLTTHLPEGFKEQARVMVPTASLKRMLDVLCSKSNYYPKKKTAKKKTAKKKS